MSPEVRLIITPGGYEKAQVLARKDEKEQESGVKLYGTIQKEVNRFADEVDKILQKNSIAKKVRN